MYCKECGHDMKSHNDLGCHINSRSGFGYCKECLE